MRSFLTREQIIIGGKAQPLLATGEKLSAYLHLLNPMPFVAHFMAVTVDEFGVNMLTHILVGDIFISYAEVVRHAQHIAFDRIFLMIEQAGTLPARFQFQRDFQCLFATRRNRLRFGTIFDGIADITLHEGVKGMQAHLPTGHGDQHIGNGLVRLEYIMAIQLTVPMLWLKREPFSLDGNMKFHIVCRIAVVRHQCIQQQRLAQEPENHVADKQHRLGMAGYLPHRPSDEIKPALHIIIKFAQPAPGSPDFSCFQILS